MSNSEDRAAWPVAVDPAGCRCTECIIGQYVPLDLVTAAQLYGMVTGKLDSHLDYGALQVTVQAALWAGVSSAVVDEVNELLARRDR